jgi:hypothetical protein
MDDMSLSAKKSRVTSKLDLKQIFPLFAGALLYNNSSPVY